MYKSCVQSLLKVRYVTVTIPIDFFVHTILRLRVPPESLDQLSDSLDLLEHLQSDIPNVEAQFEPLHDQFNILRKYEVQIPEEVDHQLDGLQGNWMAFQQCLIDSDGMLKKHKVWSKLNLILTFEGHFSIYI